MNKERREKKWYLGNIIGGGKKTKSGNWKETAKHRGRKCRITSTSRLRLSARIWCYEMATTPRLLRLQIIILDAILSSPPNWPRIHRRFLPRRIPRSPASRSSPNRPLQNSRSITGSRNPLSAILTTTSTPPVLLAILPLALPLVLCRP